MSEQVELPYGGASPNSGYSGSDTSEDRARRADSDGTTARKQRDLLTFLDSMGAHGTTWKEYSAATGQHHGATSSTLSVLHKVGKIARLTGDKRARCKVYVLPRYVNGRDTDEPGVTARTVLMDDMAAVIRSFVRSGCTIHRAADPHDDCRFCAGDNTLARYEARRKEND